MHPFRFVINFAFRFSVMNQSQTVETLGPDTWPQTSQRLCLKDIHILLESLHNLEDYHSSLVEFCTDKIVEMVQNNQEDDERDFNGFDHSIDTVLSILDAACRIVHKF